MAGFHAQMARVTGRRSGLKRSHAHESPTDSAGMPFLCLAGVLHAEGASKSNLTCDLTSASHTDHAWSGYRIRMETADSCNMLPSTLR